MKRCTIAYPEGEQYHAVTYNDADAIKAIRDLRYKSWGESAKIVLASDMDGVFEPDDLAMTYCDLLDPVNGARKFRELRDAVLSPASEGRCPYGFTLVIMADAVGLNPNVLEAVGKNVRLTPGSKEFIDFAKEDGFEYIVANTCSYETSSKEVCLRLGIEDLIAIEFGPEGLIRFAGGPGKSSALRQYLREKDLTVDDVIVIGDAWTDYNVLYDFRGSGSVAFNPKYPEINSRAKVNVYGSDLRVLAPLVYDDIEGCDDEKTIPDMVVFSGEFPKPTALIKDEIGTAKFMRKKIDDTIESVMTKEQMMILMKRESRLYDNVDMSGLKVDAIVEKALQKYSEFIRGLDD